MFPSEAELLNFFAQYAYQPWLIYCAVIVIMTLSSFGLPLPEEITILALGIVVYMGRNPEKYPPPYEGAVPVELYWAMLVCFLAVFLSDFLVYFLGRKFGDNQKVLNFIEKYFGNKNFEKARQMIQKQGFWVPAVFRFTPGVRFPGHFACGMLGIKPFQFFIADGLAALLSVPTQVFVFAYFGETILSTVGTYKKYLLIALIVGVILYLLYKRFSKPKVNLED